MLDKVGLRIEGVTSDDYGQILERMQIPRPKDSEKMYSKWHNMFVKYFPNEKRMILINSLHKLYNGIYNGDCINYNDFHWSDFNVLVDYLTELIFERSSEDFSLYSILEVGMNIHTDNYQPFQIIDRWEALENPFYVQAPAKGKPIQKTCYYSDYRVKGYDKGIEANVSGSNLLRFEIVLQQLRKVRQVLKMESDKITLKDLNEHETWVKLYRYLIATYDAIKKRPMISGAIPLEDLQKMYSYMYPPLREDIKRSIGENNFWNLMKKYKGVYDSYSLREDNYHNVIRNKMEVKFIELCN